jgi:hypothetical protein
VSALLIAVAGRARAGSRSTYIGLVNLDENAGSKRFDKLRRAFEANASGNVKGVVVLPRSEVAPYLRPDCSFAVPSEPALKMQQRGDDFMDFVVLYCSTGKTPSIKIAAYVPGDDKPYLSIALEPRSGAVGADVMADIARVIVKMSSMRVIP